MYAIKVIWKDGDEEWLTQGDMPSNVVARFITKHEAQTQANRMTKWAAKDVETIAVVKYPHRKRGTMAAGGKP